VLAANNNQPFAIVVHILAPLFGSDKLDLLLHLFDAFLFFGNNPLCLCDTAFTSSSLFSSLAHSLGSSWEACVLIGRLFPVPLLAMNI
jgi:hypothetical protein